MGQRAIVLVAALLTGCATYVYPHNDHIRDALDQTGLPDKLKNIPVSYTWKWAF